MMKRFKFLGALFVGLIGLVGFGYCGYFSVSQSFSSVNFAGNTYKTTRGNRCIQSSNSCINNIQLLDNNNNVLLSSLQTDIIYCIEDGYKFYNSSSSSCSISLGGSNSFSLYDFNGGGNCPDQYTSQECQEEYSLMPISSCNSEYCSLNGLCSTGSECPEFSGDVSALYINGLSHIGAPIIDITIPLEYQWDYMLTGNIFNLVVSGYNVDYEYIDNIIRTQNSKPNETDFNNIVSLLIPKFIPGLVIILFILFIFRFIKKIF